ncbi:hypothetical protein [Thermodesulfobium narugense]|uniref:hypothetical protein n=1 Tax=Thermodesulfobium narugense TaxID=184064 RepID=UPI00030D62B7|nr:hypothetical protein [Thermodesulfobium narugense]
MVKDATTNTDITKLKDNFEKIIFRWAGVEDITDKELGVSWAILSGNDKQNRLLHFDNGITLSYEQVGAIEKFSGYIQDFETKIKTISITSFNKKYRTRFINKVA